MSQMTCQDRWKLLLEELFEIGRLADSLRGKLGNEPDPDGPDQPAASVELSEQMAELLIRAGEARRHWQQLAREKELVPLPTYAVARIQ